MPTISKIPTVIFTHNKEDLDKTKIENEHDVQRMLYSLIRPIFPDARLEVVDDAGYASVRYDIVLDEYGI
ncbi:PD-(D/E)XK nuclease domain-containing protein [Anoxybacteroides rupiense]|uniref:PD-(D/E)XK nuclease domain-containing protein n=1 Tax=Anoxybacteroides rupiense TaxID=311460 RepID=UPI0030B842EA